MVTRHDKLVNRCLASGAHGAISHFRWDGKEFIPFFPCRCGQIHQGDYAQEDYAHHECLHEETLIQLAEDQVVCPACGASWQVEREYEGSL